jgi:hypothetical protein
MCCSAFQIVQNSCWLAAEDLEFEQFAALLAKPSSAAETGEGNCIGYAVTGPQDTLKPWRFDRRDTRSTDVRVQITHAGICHSDIHQVMMMMLHQMRHGRQDNHATSHVRCTKAQGRAKQKAYRGQTKQNQIPLKREENSDYQAKQWKSRWHDDDDFTPDATWKAG